jgi:hypothetical protein
MAIVVSDIELDRIQNLTVHENQTIVEHQIPGSEGNAFQNLGRKPVVIRIEGVLQKQKGIETLQKLREKFNAHDALSFSSDASTPADIDQIVIESLRVREIAGKPLFFIYNMVLKEVVQKPNGLFDTQALADIDAGILSEAEDFLATVEDGLDALDKAAAVKAVADKLSPQIARLGELLKKLPGS